MNKNLKVDAKLQIAVETKDGLTLPFKVYCSHPYKLTNYFRLPSGGLEYIVMNSSAGIMSNDKYLVELDLAEESQLSLISQSYEKIHKMDEGSALRITKIKIGNNASLKYFPLPTIPFANSAFSNTTNIRLANASSKLIYADFISSGRYHNNERFKYHHFSSMITVYLGNKLIFRENNNLNPKKRSPDNIGVFESYDSLANVLIYGFDSCYEKIKEYIQDKTDSKIECGITNLPYCGLIIRALGMESASLVKCITEILKYFENN